MIEGKCPTCGQFVILQYDTDGQRMWLCEVYLPCPCPVPVDSRDYLLHEVATR